MGKRIVVLNGSLKRKGNTSVLVKAVMKGAEEAGNAITEFFLRRMDI